MAKKSQHKEWLSYIDISGPFLSPPVLDKEFNTGLDVLPKGMYNNLKAAYSEWKESPLEKHNIWIRYLLEQLDYTPHDFLEGNSIPSNWSIRLPDTSERIAPSMVLKEGDSPKARLFIFIYPPGTRLDKTNKELKKVPIYIMSDLLYSTGVNLGLVTNGEEWILVNALKESTAGFATFQANVFFDPSTKITFQAFYSIVHKRRFFGVPVPNQLDSLFQESLSYQQVVTDKLGSQVRNAIEVFIQTLDDKDRERNRELLGNIDDSVLYEAALTFMMRIVIVLTAEEKEMFPVNDSFYVQNYSISSMRDVLRNTEEEILGNKYDAYNRLLALFRLIYSGSKHNKFTMAAYGGSLFNPDRFPFLEGRKSNTSFTNTPADPLPVDNRTILHILESIQFIQEDGEFSRVSFRTLDVEQIGYVYETLLEHKAERSKDTILKFQCSKDKEADIRLEDIQVHKNTLYEFLKEKTGRSLSALKNNSEPDITSIEKLKTACGHIDSLYNEVYPVAGLLRKDSFGYPYIIRKDSLHVTGGDQRRSTGAHYTPQSLTYTVVKNTLDPILYKEYSKYLKDGSGELLSPAEILDLKVCDPSCGSGAFLVQACRYLSEKLVESWEKELGSNKNDSSLYTIPYSKKSLGDPSELILPETKEERLSIAKRLVVDKCLYGVDINPLAVEMAKLSLWLVTLQKDKPFTFLDHSIRCGDSLLGGSELDYKEWTVGEDENESTFYHRYATEVLYKAKVLREELESFPVNTAEDYHQKETKLKEAEAEALKLKNILNIITYYKLEKRNLKDSEKGEILFEFKEKGGVFESKKYISIIQEMKLKKAFHWEFEFPEVFDRKRDVVMLSEMEPHHSTPESGFDVIIGNPPFMGGQKLTGNLGVNYREYLVNGLGNGVRGSADLVAYFYLRSFGLLNETGNFGLISTNTIAQGDTREVGLDQIVASPISPNPSFPQGQRGNSQNLKSSDSGIGQRENTGTIYRATPSMKWPNAAAVYISIVWVTKKDWKIKCILEKENGSTTEHDEITPYLVPKGKVMGKPYRLKENENKSFQGSIVLGMGFVLEPEEAEALIQKNPKNKDCLYPYLNGEDLNSSFDQSPSRWVINFFDWPLRRGDGLGNRSEGFGNRGLESWGKTPLEKMVEDLDVLIHDTLSENDNLHKIIRLWDVSDNEAKIILEKTNLDVSNYSHTLENYAIQHILKQHTEDIKEGSRGQIPVTLEDIYKIPEILFAPDSIEYAGKNKKGLETIRYTKTIEEVLYYFEEVREGKQQLAGVTLYKRKPERVNAGKNPLPLTPEAFLRYVGKCRNNLVRRQEEKRPSDMFTFYEDPPDIDKELSKKRKEWLREGIVPFDYPYPVAADYPDLLEIVEVKVKPERTRKNEKGEYALRYPLNIKWWIYGKKRPALYATIAGMERVMVSCRVSKYILHAIVIPNCIFNVTTNVFAISVNSILDSNIYEIWVREQGSSLGMDTCYTNGDCFETFPFPYLTPESDLSVGRLQKNLTRSSIGELYYLLRQEIMQKNKEGLTKTYNRFHNPNEKSADIQKLRELHVQMDNAVKDAYGWSDLSLEHGFHDTKQGTRFTISESARREVLDRLLELNHKRHAIELEMDKKEADKEANNKPKSKKKTDDSAGGKDLFGKEIPTNLFGGEDA